MKEAFIDIRKQLEKKLKKDRFEHTIGVMYTAASLAMRYHEDIDDAMMAGLLHDCGKYGSAENGEQVVALIEDGATVKTFYREEGIIRLQPENDAYDPIILTDVTILGKVICVIRMY